MNSASLNQRAHDLCAHLATHATRLRADVHCSTGGATIIDLGVKATGGLEAGRLLAETCLAGLGQVSLMPSNPALWNGPSVAVSTDHPVAACMASQYAGWQISHEKFFAMGSGPMRAAAGKEELFTSIGHTERPDVAVGCLETSKLPPDAVIARLAADCGVPPDRLTLLCARTGSQAGTLQVVARSIETALHKLHELKFDLARIESGWGVAPLPPVVGDDLAAIGRTNDAVLYGAEVTLWVRGDDESLEEIGPRVPACASSDYGEPFATIFRRYDGDFYRIDPLLFSPAVVHLANLDTGRRHTFGHTAADVVRQSFTSAS